MSNNDLFGCFNEEMESEMSDTEFKAFLITLLEFVKKADSIDEVSEHLEKLMSVLE